MVWIKIDNTILNTDEYIQFLSINEKEENLILGNEKEEYLISGKRKNGDIDLFGRYESKYWRDEVFSNILSQIKEEG